MEPRIESKSRFRIEKLEDRIAPASCQAFGRDHVAALAQTVVPLGSVVVSPIAQSGPGAVAAVILADHEIFCS